MIDLTLNELLTGLDLSDDGILVTPDMLEAAKVAMEAWLTSQGVEDIDGLFQPALAVQIYRAMAVVDPVRNRLQVDEQYGSEGEVGQKTNER